MNVQQRVQHPHLSPQGVSTLTKQPQHPQFAGRLVTVQVTQIQKIPTSHNNNNDNNSSNKNCPTHHYRLILSDGLRSISARLSTHLNSLIETTTSTPLRENGLLRIDKFECVQEEGNQTVISITQAVVLLEQPAEPIGSPIHMYSAPGSPRLNNRNASALSSSFSAEASKRSAVDMDTSQASLLRKRSEPDHDRNSNSLLTPQGIAKLTRSVPNQEQQLEPINVQVLVTKPIHASTGGQRFLAVLSDGEYKLTAMLSSELGQLAERGQLPNNAIVRISDSVFQVHSGKPVLIVVMATVVAHEQQCIGSPLEFPYKAAPEEQQQAQTKPPPVASSDVVTRQSDSKPAARVSLSPHTSLAHPPLTTSATTSLSQESNGTATAASASDASEDASEEQDEQDQGEEEDAEEMTLLCQTQQPFKIVGIRYYHGTVRSGEFVQLIREPENPFDRNAVRVDNMQGIKVGHIKREQAATLTPILDDHAQEIKVYGLIVGNGNKFDIPVKMEFYGIWDRNSPETQGKDKEAAMDNLARVVQQSFERRIPNHGVNWERNIGSSSSRAAAASRPPPPKVERRSLDWATEQQQLDAMFDKQMREQLAQVPPLKEEPLSHLFRSSVNLYPHQKEGIAWLVHQETSGKPPLFYRKVKEQNRTVWLCEVTQCSQPTEPPSVRGGILADEMGLGKSLQTIGLILAAPPAGRTFCPIKSMEVDESGEEEDSKPHSPTPIPTPQLKKKKVAELREMLKNAGLPTTGKKAELVSSLEEYFKGCPAPAVPVPSSAAPASKPAPCCTLIVAPVSVLSNWAHQIQSHVEDGVLRVEMYHGPNRHELVRHIQVNKVDVLLVSYHTLVGDFTNRFDTKDNNSDDSKGKSEGAKKQSAKKRRKIATLFDVDFHRIVLDEAHTVRSPTTKFFKAVKEVKAQRKLALTGTPFVNRPDDIHSLFSFLELAPLSNKTIFKRSITTPIQVGQDIGLARLRAALAHVALRRSKAACQIKLVNKEVQLRAITFPDCPDKELYDTLYSTFRMAVRACLAGGDANVLKQYSSVLEVLLRMRQACCSGVLVPEERREAALQTWRSLQNRDATANPLTAEEGKKLMEQLTNALGGGADKQVSECAICFEELDESTTVAVRTCSHVFCSPCLSQVASTTKKCPMCRKPFQKGDMVKKDAVAAALSQQEDSDTPAKTIEFDKESHTSPKIAALLEAIKEMKSDEKAVIFSQFTSFLDIVGKTLNTSQLPFLRIDGRMNADRRHKAITEFGAESGPRFMLASLHAAGTGINLTRANVVFMLDCWWNQSVENQAMDRVHRIGQQRDVRVHRFVMKDSVEERMVSIQESKNMQAKAAFARLSDEEKKLSRLRDLRTLLQISEEEKAVGAQNA